MSTSLNIRVSFLEPYRLIEWFEKEKRKTDKKSLRGQTFAQWHKEKSGENCSPYITGTLLRSAVLKSAEELISLSNEWSEYCNGHFETKSGKPPKFRRKRTTIQRKTDRVCSANNPCPLCIIMGVFDNAGKGEDAKKDIRNHHVHFSNLDLFSEQPRKKIEDIAKERTLNRVDKDTGKAQDYFKIWEVEDQKYWNYTGTITVNNDGARELLESSLKFVDKLCGAQCKIEIMKDHESKTFTDKVVYSILNEDQEIKLTDAADKIISAFENQGKLEKIRALADTIRMMNIKEIELKFLKNDEQLDILDNLPKGKEDKKHFIWDLEVEGKPLRTFLKDFRPAEKENWKNFYETLGQKLYELLKKNQGEVLGSLRALGESEYYSEHNPTDLNITTVQEEKVKEFIVTGNLRAETPFYIGVDSEDGEQTSSQILLTQDGKYRIPRSTLRGVLRMDLRTAFDTGCEVKLGGDTPCDCPVCLVMRNVTIMNTRSQYTNPPEIRNRIRMNPYTSTTDEGALFDMEVGPEGLEFDFVLRYRGADFPKELYSVLHYWSEGTAFLGGSTSTGKGRFSLKDLKIFEWDFEQGLSAYIKYYGFRGEEKEKLLNNNIQDYIKSYPDDEKKQKLLRPYNDYLKPRWKKVEYEIEFKAPLLTADPIAALLDIENHDKIAFEKIVVKENEIDYTTPAIKGETIRGIIRKAVGKRNGDLEKDHEDCQCSLCRIFGNEHEISKVRFEDLSPDEALVKTEGDKLKKKIDHVAISRYLGGAEDSMKFDTYPLAGNPKKPLYLKGKIWIRKDVKEEDIENLKTALLEMHHGLHPVGGKSGTGYGWVTNLKILNADDSFKLPEIDKTTSAEKSIIEYPKLPDLMIDTNSVYYPHYFLKPGNKVERQQNPDSSSSEIIGHERWDPDLLSGKIKCKLDTLTPLIIPDTVKKSDNDMNGYEEDKIGHKTYKFFRINGEELIPGSEIRGMISNVYEALTNSCFRILDESKYISWRMKPEEFAGGYKAGRVIKEDEQLKIVEAQASIRLPLYDDEYLINEILNPTGEILNQRNGNNRWKNALSANTIIAAAAINNKNYLKEHSDKLEILKGKIKVKFDEKIVFQIENKKTGKITIIDKVAILNGKGQYEGYIKLTGPNNAEVENNGSKDDDIDDNWNPMDLNISLSTSYKLKASKNQFYPRPFLQFIKDKKEYTVTKRCERIFVMQKNGRKYSVTKLAEEQYNIIRKTYEKNKKELADQFATIINNDLAEGDLVYFLPGSGNNVKAIIPVCISRNAASKPLGKKFDNENFRSCEREWIENFEMPSELKTDSFKKYFLRHPDGYCPACRLFGTTYYRGRVRFGFAHLSHEPIWIAYTKKYMEEAINDGKKVIPMVPLLKKKMEGNPHSITLPLLERPRPTWSIPDDTFNIPGRKFYIHHNGWEKIVSDNVNGNIAQTKNNRTVEPLEMGNEFEFEVFFKNLNKEELGLLLYSLELEPGMAHKLGTGKPLGFGSVDIKVENLETFSFDENKLKINSEKDKNTYIKLGLKSLSNEKQWSEIEHIKQLRYLLKIPEVSPRVEYPVLNAEDEKIIGYSYEQIKDNEEKKNGKVLEAEDIRTNHEERIKKLITPWVPWLD